MLLKLAVLLMSIGQVVGAAYLSIGTFEQSARALPVFVQPAGWAFSIWGLIYTLSFVYAVYQIIPSKDNPTLAATRWPALTAFVGSTAWLFFAGMQSALVWLTIPILFGIACTLSYVIEAPDTPDETNTVLAKRILYPYAAWTAIASWINIPTLLIEREVVTTAAVNYGLNLLLFAGIAGTVLYYFRKTGYSAWYGGVIIWAANGVVATNYPRAEWLFVALAVSLIVVVVGLYGRKQVF